MATIETADANSIRISTDRATIERAGAEAMRITRDQRGKKGDYKKGGCAEVIRITKDQREEGGGDNKESGRRGNANNEGPEGEEGAMRITTDHGGMKGRQ